MERAGKILFVLALAGLSVVAARAALPCEEGYTSVPVKVSGGVAPGKSFRQEISLPYYFADGTLGEKKVAETPSPHVYFWLVPQGKGWRVSIGPKANMKPDYLGITSVPYRQPLVISAAAPPKDVSLCFTLADEDYYAATDEVMMTGESDIIEIFSEQCQEKDEGIGIGALNAQALPSGGLSFEADLTIPVYTTDCPAP